MKRLHWPQEAASVASCDEQIGSECSSPWLPLGPQSGHSRKRKLLHQRPFLLLSPEMTVISQRPIKNNGLQPPSTIYLQMVSFQRERGGRAEEGAWHDRFALNVTKRVEVNVGSLSCLRCQRFVHKQLVLHQATCSQDRKQQW